MILFWGVGCLPLAVVGVVTDIRLIAAAVFVVGICFSAPMVIWGTLLQRRVPPAMLGRVSSLDFFVSLAFMPLSMAVAGPVSATIGVGATFLLAGALPGVIAVVAIVAARMPRDEIANPLDEPGEPTTPAADALVTGVTVPGAAERPRDVHALVAGPAAGVREPAVACV